jgi:hypothetical protein
MKIALFKELENQNWLETLTQTQFSIESDFLGDDKIILEPTQLNEI